ncbi:hypothetical protein DFH27DRAFT_540784 [Peziza echinospora]|nr:hypothetical protein DFH27DRAFT_540784 [Peziza echinospora]
MNSGDDEMALPMGMDPHPHVHPLPLQHQHQHHSPPDLDEWRRRLFTVDTSITMTAAEWDTYWPYIDNVWSHRSTQRSKKGPFVTHYYDCRLKGRPPGTPVNQDPNKKKRKRTARERDLCEMKIKIIETTTPNKTYTIEKVKREIGTNGEEPAGEYHRHTLDESDRIKRNSVLRQAIKLEKEIKKVQTNQQQKTYHKKATGQALQTVKRHSKSNDLKVFGSCFCPFAQRVWIALEVKGINYQYIEVDPYKKPANLLEIDPRGLVPSLKHGDWGCYESSVILEYLEDLQVGHQLLHNHSQIRANSRLWCHHIDRRIVPRFNRYIQEQDPLKFAEHGEELRMEITKLVNNADPVGPFFLGSFITLVDVSIAPWFLRLRRVLTPCRGWQPADEGSRLGIWIAALEASEAVKNTTSDDSLYLDSYDRYSDNNNLDFIDLVFDRN